MSVDRSAPVPPEPAGVFESISGRFARGWAVDRAKPQGGIEVELLVGGEVIATARTGLPRPDVERALGATDAGFRIVLPADLTRGEEVNVRLAGTSAPLPRAAGFSISAILEERGDVVRRPAGHGCVDEVCGNRVRGWAALPDSDEPAQILFYAGRKLVGSALAMEDRPDVEAAGAGPRRSGFDTELRLPRTGGSIEIHARVRGDGAELTGGKFRMTCPAPSSSLPVHFDAAPGIPLMCRETAAGTRYGFADGAAITLAGRDDGAVDLFFGVTRLGIVPRDDLAISTTDGFTTRGDHLLASLTMLSAFTDRRDDHLAIEGERSPIRLMTRADLFRCWRLWETARSVSLRDASLVTSRTLRLVFDINNDVGAAVDAAGIAVYQLASGGQRMALCAQATLPEAFDGAEVIMDAALPDSFRPIIVTLTGTDGQLLDIDLLPFPSMCRGGWHEPELRSLASGPDEQQALAQLSGALVQALWQRNGEGPRIAIEERGITGTEPGITSSAATWIANQLGGRLGLLASDDAYLGEIRPLSLLTRDEADAILPSDALPAISLLVQPRSAGDFVSAGYVAADIEHSDRCWHVRMPPLGRWFQEVQPADATLWCPWVRWGTAGRPPLTCVRHQRSTAPDPSTTFFPLRPDTAATTNARPDAGGITIVMFANTAASSFAIAIEVIAQQAIANRCDLIVVDPDPEAELPAVVDLHFNGRARLVTLRSPGDALRLIAKGRLPSAPTVAVCAGTAILHDIWTLQALQQVSMTPEVGWVACPVVTGSGTKVKVDGWGAAITGVSVMDVASAQLTPWPNDLIPTMAAVPVGVTPTAISMIGAKKLARLDPRGVDDMSWTVAALSFGFVNLCLTTVTAFSSIPVEPVDRRSAPLLDSAGEIDRLLRVSSVARRRSQ